MNRKSMFWQILLSFVLVIIVLLGGMAAYMIGVLKTLYDDSVEETLLAQARIIQTQVEPLLKQAPDEVAGVCEDLKNRGLARVSVMLLDGRVVGDTERNPETMENHADRPEFQQVVGGKETGRAIRMSPTLGIGMMYAAIPVMADGVCIGVIRTAMPLVQLNENFRAIRRHAVQAFALSLVIAFMLALILSHRISRPLKVMTQAARHFATGDFNMRVHLTGSSEMLSLADSMNWMAAQLDERISTIKQQQCEMQAIISSMEEGVVALDTSNIIININHAAAAMLNTTVQDAAGKILEEVVQHQTLCNLVREVRNGSSMLEADVTTHEGNAMRYFQVRATTLRSGEKRMIGALLVMNDITRLRKLEKMRRDFVANVSHELKTPVTSIKGFVETLLDGAGDPETVNKFLQIISRQTNRLNAIIEDLLNLSRIERDREYGEIDFHEGHVSEVLENAAQICRPEAERKGIAIQVEARPDISVRMNAELIEQSVVNLINNAVKYSEEHKHIQVRAEERHDEVILSVLDEGVGIAEEHIPRLFERFYRVDKNRSRQMGGTGLGLAIVKHIVMAHQGAIDVRSEPGKGSCFTIHLPKK